MGELKMPLTIREAIQADQSAVIRLFHFLSPNYRDNSEAYTDALVLTDTWVFIGVNDGQIVATATLSVRGVPSAGRVGYIDDVVVDPECRGLGAGQAMSLHCVRKAKEEGCVRVELTSHPSREAANALYQKLGFQRRETNNYVLKF